MAVAGGLTPVVDYAAPRPGDVRHSLAEWFGTRVAVRDGLLAVPHDVEIRPGEWGVAHYMFGTAPDVGSPLGECLAENDPRVNPIFRGKGAS